VNVAPFAVVLQETGALESAAAFPEILNLYVHPALDGY
jgi:hypothetical protein